MNKTSWAGLIAIVVGLICVFVAGVGIQNKQEVFRIGGISATSSTTKTYPALRYVGGGLIVAGAIIVGIGYVNRR